MRPTLTLTSKNNTRALMDAMRSLERSDVLVGIPEETSPRKGEPISNAQLMYIHTRGSRLKNIPARPVIEPAIEQPDTRALIAAELKTAAVEVLAGNPGAATRNLRRAGTLGSNAAKRWFRNPRNNWAPNAESTIRRKGSDEPLIGLTGEFRRSITFVVREEK